MGDKIYVLIASGGSYDDAWERNVVASADLTKLQLKVVEEEAEIEALRAWQAKRAAFLEQWKQENPEPELGQQPAEKTWPRWGPSQSITQQMRDDRQAIKDEIARVYDEWKAPQTEWLTRQQAADEKFIAESGRRKRDTRHSATDVYYRIEDVPFI